MKPDGKKYKVNFKAKVTVSNVMEDFTLSQNRNQMIPDETDYEERIKPKFDDQFKGLLICRFPSFLVEPISVEKLLDKANHNRALILDLRGAGGIVAKALELRIRLNRENVDYIVPELGKHAIDRDDGDLETLKLITASLLRAGQPIGELKSRKGTEKLKAYTNPSEAFSGKIAVLVDNETSGAAEVFARLIQLEKRGIILGEVTAGRSVKTSFLVHSSWVTFTSPFGLQVPSAEIVLANGDRLNEKGVTPDQIMSPSQSDFVKGNDPVMASAAQQLGFTLSPEDAGKIFEKKK
ncbi:MAG: S41 family peptidase [Acidobacteriota bacterium]